MATKTPNYNLTKPAQTDFYDVDVQNGNMDIIDDALTEKVQREIGKELSTNDYNDVDKNKVDNLPVDANATFINRVRSAKAGNFPVLNDAGSLVDSGKNPLDFLPVSHETTTIVGKNGLHGLRCQNEKLEVFDGNAWVQPLDGIAGLDSTGKLIQMPTATDVGAVPATRKINNKVLSSDLTLSAADVGAVPTTRKINNKSLSSDITLTPADIGIPKTAV